MKLTSIIVDDLASSRNELQYLIETYCPEIIVSHQFDNVEDAYQYMEATNIDVVFLDVQMPGGDGFQLLERFQQRNFQVVFVTGYADYSIRAIRMNALDYLMKPIDPGELQLTVRRLMEIKKEEKSFEVMQRSLTYFQEQIQGRKKAEHITLHHQGGFDIVCINDILYLKAERGYTNFTMKDNRKILVSKTIKVFDELLSEFNFIRIHKTFLVNLYSIQKYKHEDIGWVIITNGDRLEVSRRRTADLMKAIDAMKIFSS